MAYARHPETYEKARRSHQAQIFEPATYFDFHAIKERRIQFAVRALVHLLPDEYAEAIRRAEIERANAGVTGQAAK